MKRFEKCKLWMLMLILVFSMTACGGNEEDTKSADEDRIEEEDDKDRDKDEDKKDKEAGKDEEDNDKDSKDKDSDDKEAVEEPETDVFDAQAIVENMINATAGKSFTKVTSITEMDMSMSMEGVSIAFGGTVTGTTLMQLEPYTAYTTTELTMEMDGQTETMVSESYILTEDGKLKSYMYDSENDQWASMDLGMTEADIMEQQMSSLAWLQEMEPVDFVVDPQLHQLDGRDVYKIDFTLTGEEMNHMLSGMTSVTDMLAEYGLGELDMSSLNVPTVYYIDATTYQLVQMEMNMNGLDKLMQDMMSTMLGDSEYQFSMSFDKCKAVYKDISYEPVEIPELPAEALVGTEGSPAVEEQPEVRDDAEVTEAAIYTIEESGVSVQIACPQDWSVVESAYDSLYIENDATWQGVEFLMLAGVTGEELLAYVEDMITTELQTNTEFYVSHGAGPQLGDYETMELIGNGVNYYFAWAPVEDCWIFVMVLDFEGQSLEETLPPVLEMIILENTL